MLNNYVKHWQVRYMIGDKQVEQRVVFNPILPKESSTTLIVVCNKPFSPLASMLGLKSSARVLWMTFLQKLVNVPEL